MTNAAAADDGPLRPAPFLSSVMQIEPQWIDYNGHLNMAYYNVMFDRAIDEFWLRLGIGPGYMRERHGSTFTAECHVRYLREIHLGDPVKAQVGRENLTVKFLALEQPHEQKEVEQFDGALKKLRGLKGFVKWRAD